MWGTPRNPEEQQGERFREADAWNRVLIIRPIEYVESIKVRDEVRDALKLNVVDLTTGTLYREILWFSAPLIGTFKGAIGTPFLGYITKEKNSGGFMAWKFYDLANDAEWDGHAQAWLSQHPEFLAPVAPRASFGGHDTSHHENGPAPEWAGAVPQRPSGPPAPPQAPPAPPRPGAGGFPAPPQPPAPPVSAPPAPPVAGGDLMTRLRAQAAGQPVSGPGGNVGSAEQEPPY